MSNLNPPTVGSKKAISSFFSKGKKDSSTSSSSSATGVSSSSSGGTTAFESSSSNSSSFPTKLGGLEIGSAYSGILSSSSSDWISDVIVPEVSTAPAYERLSTTLGLGGSKLKMHVVDVEDAGEDREVDLAKQREAEEAKMALISAVSKKKKAEAKAAQERALAEAEGALTAAPAPAAGPKPSWKEKIEAKKAAEAAGGGSSSSGSDWSTQNARQRRGLDLTSTAAPPNLNSVMDFPMLPGQTLPQVQSSVTTASGSVVSNARITSSNIWSALGASNDDDDDNEDDNNDNEDEDKNNKNEMENGTGRNEIDSSLVSVPTVGKNITSSSTKVTSASSSSSSTSSSTSDALQLGLVQGEGASITTEDATRKLAQNIMRELRSSLESGEALRRLAGMNCNPVSLRTLAIEETILSATETDKLGERMQIAKVLLTLVPAKIVTRDMLITAVSTVCSLFEDIRVDAPKAGPQISEVLASGVIEGTIRNPTGGMVAPIPPQRDYVHSSAVLEKSGYVPIGYIHPDIAKEVNKLSGSKLDKVIKDAGKKLTLPSEEIKIIPPVVSTTTTSAVVPTPASATALVTSTQSTTVSQIATETTTSSTVLDEEFSTAVKKKKKKAAVAVDDE